MIKKLMNLELETLDTFDNWPTWTRWFFALPVSFGAYTIVYWLVSLINQWKITEDTVLGTVFMHVFFALIPLYIFYNIIPKHKMVFTGILSGFYLVIHGFMIVGGVFFIVIGEREFLNHFSHSVLPSLLGFATVLVLLNMFRKHSKLSKEEAI
ncbi:membrane protein of unknown function [Petrocella atlantisensis]|uniref:Uncharacterized protein n=1 Tax=Petrocella atlantisensis TaxID=2173034 RepID=A0A3P7PZV3_9FIRM|nr:hypothetical protein [Petrocella atlantisensis]VDN48681.1 membrane protein of unknown function [Petrocella atlantisensis]